MGIRSGQLESVKKNQATPWEAAPLLFTSSAMLVFSFVLRARQYDLTVSRDEMIDTHVSVARLVSSEAVLSPAAAAWAILILICCTSPVSFKTLFLILPTCNAAAGGYNSAPWKFLETKSKRRTCGTRRGVDLRVKLIGLRAFGSLPHRA